jgi:hypothetical protein
MVVKMDFVALARRLAHDYGIDTAVPQGWIDQLFAGGIDEEPRHGVSPG